MIRAVARGLDACGTFDLVRHATDRVSTESVAQEVESDRDHDQHGQQTKEACLEIPLYTDHVLYPFVVID